MTTDIIKRSSYLKSEKKNKSKQNSNPGISDEAKKNNIGRIKKIDRILQCINEGTEEDYQVYSFNGSKANSNNNESDKRVISQATSGEGFIPTGPKPRITNDTSDVLPTIPNSQLSFAHSGNSVWCGISNQLQIMRQNLQLNVSVIFGCAFGHKYEIDYDVCQSACEELVLQLSKSNDYWKLKRGLPIFNRMTEPEFKRALVSSLMFSLAYAYKTVDQNVNGKGSIDETRFLETLNELKYPACFVHFIRSVFQKDLLLELGNLDSAHISNEMVPFSDSRWNDSPFAQILESGQSNDEFRKLLLMSKYLQNECNICKWYSIKESDLHFKEQTPCGASPFFNGKRVWIPISMPFLQTDVLSYIFPSTLKYESELISLTMISNPYKEIARDRKLDLLICSSFFELPLFKSGSGFNDLVISEPTSYYVPPSSTIFSRVNNTQENSGANGSDEPSNNSSDEDVGELQLKQEIGNDAEIPTIQETDPSSIDQQPPE